jgi:CheY-like chemotaxis protein
MNQYVFILIDDSDLDRFINHKFLSLSGMASSILSFSSCEEGLEYLDSHKGIEETVVLLDIQVPGMSGFKFLDLFCEMEESKRKHIKVFMLSSTVDPADIEYAAKHPCLTDLLSKPLDINVLQQKLEKL